MNFDNTTIAVKVLATRPHLDVNCLIEIAIVLAVAIFLDIRRQKSNVITE